MLNLIMFPFGSIIEISTDELNNTELSENAWLFSVQNFLNMRTKALSLYYGRHKAKT